MNIQFQLDVRKAVEAVALLLKLNGGSMNYMGLLKMLYIADRKSLERMDSPIIGDRYFSLDYGPVLSGVYDLIKGLDVNSEYAKGSSAVWQEHISVRPSNHKVNRQYKINLIKDPGVGELCQEEEEILEEVYSTFKGIDPFEVANWTHGLPEWRDPSGSRLAISVEHILMYLQKTSEEIDQIRQEAEEEAFISQIVNAD